MKQILSGVACGLILVAGMGACQQDKRSEMASRSDSEGRGLVEQAVQHNVKPNCIISWDPSEDRRISEYRVTVWKAGAEKPSDKAMYKVNAPANQLSCKQVGATAAGQWQASVQACLKDGICSESSKPILFKVVEER